MTMSSFPAKRRRGGESTKALAKFVFLATGLVAILGLGGVMMAFISTVTSSVDRGTSTVAGSWAVVLIGLAVLLFVLMQGKRRR